MYPQFSTYILTNQNHTVLYTGFTNNLAFRLIEHWVGHERAFTTTYKAYYLVWHEETRYVLNAIALEKEIKTWMHFRKEALINSFNPSWRHLNEAIVGAWPPTPEMIENMLSWRRIEDEIARKKGGQKGQADQ